MSRRGQRSRVQLQQVGKRKRPLAVWDEDVEPNNNFIRRGAEGKIYNRIHNPEDFYGFLTKADGPKHGPWDAVFECTPALWMNFTIWGLPYDTRTRVLQALDSRPFAEAWENCGIAGRVVLRHAHGRYLEALENDETVQLVQYEIVIDRDDLNDRFGLDVLRPGHWYGLELAKSNLAVDIETGILREFNRTTLELGEEQSYTLKALVALRPLPPRHDEFVFGKFESEPLVEAFHSRFGEVVEEIPELVDDDDIDIDVDDDDVDDNNGGGGSDVEID